VKENALSSLIYAAMLYAETWNDHRVSYGTNDDELIARTAARLDTVTTIIRCAALEYAEARMWESNHAD
jgi:hypothetical protein